MAPKLSINFLAAQLDEMRQAMEERATRDAERDVQFQQQRDHLTALLTRLNQDQGPAPLPRAQDAANPAGQPRREEAQGYQPQAPAAQQNRPPAAEPVRDVLRMPVLAPVVAEPVYERFRRQKPPMFEGSPDPAVAENWIKRIQQILNYMQLPDAERVACAINQLDKEARCWWEVVAQSENAGAVTWPRFLELFYEKYLGEARLAGKVREFMKLVQGNLSVAEYTAKFDELAKYAPNVIPNDAARKTRYMFGLRKEVAKQVDSGETGPDTYSSAVKRALRIDGWDDHHPNVSERNPNISSTTTQVVNPGKEEEGRSGKDGYSSRNSQVKQGNQGNFRKGQSKKRFGRSFRGNKQEGGRNSGG